MTTSAETVAPAARSPWTNDAVIQATEGFAALSKIGTKDKTILKRLTKMIVWAKDAAQEFFISRDTLTNTWAEKDDDDNIKVRASDDGKGQAPVMRNMVEYQLRLNELLRGPAKYEGDAPEPFSWEDLDKFQKTPDALVIASLGPFVKLD